MSFLLLLQPLPIFSSSPTLNFLQNPHPVPSLLSVKPRNPLHPKPLKAPSFALTGESSPDSPEPLDTHSFLRQLSDSLELPSDYFEKLPRDLRLDLNDAAFDLSNGAVIDECGQELGQLLLNLSRAWELGETSTSYTLAKKLPILESNLTNKAKSALGKRLVSAGRRFQSMGQYGQGELQKGYENKSLVDFMSIQIAQAMITTGKTLSASSVQAVTDEELKEDTRVFKFGELQVEITPGKANVGAAIALVFGALSWGLAQGIQNIPESSLQYANDNALVLAKSLRGTLLAIGYSSTVLSAFTTVGLLLLARQLKSKED